MIRNRRPPAPPPEVPIHDPYRRCTEVCTHNLDRGVLVSKLLKEDGPFPQDHPVFSMNPRTFTVAVPNVLIQPTDPRPED